MDSLKKYVAGEAVKPIKPNPVAIAALTALFTAAALSVLSEDETVVLDEAYDETAVCDLEVDEMNLGESNEPEVLSNVVILVPEGALAGPASHCWIKEPGTVEISRSGAVRSDLIPHWSNYCVDGFVHEPDHVYAERRPAPGTLTLEKKGMITDLGAVVGRWPVNYFDDIEPFDL